MTADVISSRRGKGPRLNRGPTSAIDQLPGNIQMLLEDIMQSFEDRRILLWGSYLKGDWDEKNSDIDILIEGYDRHSADGHIITKLSELHNIKIDVFKGDQAIKTGLIGWEIPR